MADRGSAVALVDGPVAGGRVTGLRIPITGRFDEAARCALATISLRIGSLSIVGCGSTDARPRCAPSSAILQRATGGSMDIAAPS
jgi:hypothetical protein